MRDGYQGRVSGTGTSDEVLGTITAVDNTVFP